MRKTGNITVYRENLKTRILETSMQLFKQKGIRAVKMDDIATEMGISKRTLYEIYSNKEDLLYECVKHDSEKMTKQLQEHAEKTDNEMDVIAFFLKAKLRDLGTINPRFFLETQKYSKIVAFLQEYNERQRANSYLFMKKGIEHGFFRGDINYDIVHKMSDAAMNYVMQTKMYRKYSLKEIFHTFITVYMRGCCTNKGLDYLEKYMDESKINK